jgi:arginyl-tRNA synthetase
MFKKLKNWVVKNNGSIKNTLTDEELAEKARKDKELADKIRSKGNGYLLRADLVTISTSDGRVVTLREILDRLETLEKKR